MHYPDTKQHKRVYSRKRMFHRNYQDIERCVLNHLMHEGPTSITRLINICQINYKQTKKAVSHLAYNGLVERTDSEERMNKALNYSYYVIRITALGRQYIDKANELELMLKAWQN